MRIQQSPEVNDPGSPVLGVIRFFAPASLDFRRMLKAAIGLSPLSAAAGGVCMAPPCGKRDMVGSRDIEILSVD